MIISFVIIVINKDAGIWTMHPYTRDNEKNGGLFYAQAANRQLRVKTVSCWQEQKASNLQPSVLETDALPVELYSYITVNNNRYMQLFYGVTMTRLRGFSAVAL